jgi:hypothetical protein
MDTATVVVIVLVVLVVIAAGALAVLWERRRSGRLKEKFGPEYERAIEDAGDRRSAEKQLRGREKRHTELELRSMTSESAQRYRDEWNSVQALFVDEPGSAVEQADRLVVRMMRERGYPVDEFDQRAADISVDHPEVAQSYREAHSIAVARAEGRGDTEQLRRAVTSYRRLVDALLEDGGPAGDTYPSNTKEQA